jgi:hypothetical protein
MNHLKNYEEFNEGKKFRGALKTVNVIGTGLKSLASIITLNWNSLVFNLKSFPYGNKLIDIMDIFRDTDSGFFMEDKLKSYKKNFGRDMISDIDEVKEFINSSKISDKRKDKQLNVLDKFKETIDQALLDDESFKDTLQDLKNKIVDLSKMSRERGYNSGIEYPEDYSDKPISKMNDKELDKEMDKALDDKNFTKAKFIGSHLNKSNI